MPDITQSELDLQNCLDREDFVLKSENVQKLKEIALRPLNAKCAEDMEKQEKAIIKLANFYSKNMEDQNLLALIPVLRKFLACPKKARTARLIRVMLDVFLDTDLDRNEAIKLCVECVEWARNDKKTFLCQIFEIKLASFLFETNRLTEAVELSERLVADLKKMSYKDELIEILIVLCRVYYVMGNYKKCRALLTSVRTTANTTHLSPKIQAKIDLLTGSIHCKETDYQTAYSYFYEAFELFDNIESRTAIRALKYMLFCKIMIGRPDDVPTVLSGKLSLKYRSCELDSMKAVAKVFKEKNLSGMKALLLKYPTELVEDIVVKVHLKELHDTLFENNLNMVIEPYSVVELSHIATLVKMDVAEVINRIARMILDGKLNATLDQGFGTLEVFPFKKDEGLYKKCTECVQSLSHVVEVLKKRRALLV